MSFSSRTDSPEEVVARYPVGKKVIVHYDASSPSYSVLEKNTLGLGVIFRVCLMTAIIVGVLVYLGFGFRDWFKSRRY
ncbi:DUF3592 domain-containing protein [Pleionea mediterranea]|uniref:DUF3592 domain-containing protein n=1 Tax=Pleionea mediterranea TaxID=523701 RepID=UPI003CCA6B88